MKKYKNKLTKKDLQVLEQIEEGNTSLDSLYSFLDLDIEEIKEILYKLEKLNLIKIDKKVDKYYNKEFWNINIKHKKESKVKKAA